MPSLSAPPPPRGVEKDRLKGSVEVGTRDGVAVGVGPTSEFALWIEGLASTPAA